MPDLPEAMTPRPPAALGFRAHSGWAAMLAVGGPPQSPAVLHRERLLLTDERLPHEPYHAASCLDLGQAEALVRRAAEQATAFAVRAIRSALAELREAGHDVVGCGVVLGSGRPELSLAKAVSSHPGMHAAEGELFRQTLIEACQGCGLPVTAIREPELYARGAAALGLPVAALRERIATLGRPLGPPWGQDQKAAALVALVALVAANS